MVQRLLLSTFTAAGTGSISGQGTKIKQALWCGKKIKAVRKINESIKKNLWIFKIQNQVSRYKINIQKSVAFLYPNNELLEGEDNKTVPFTITLIRIKYLRGSILDMEDLYITKIQGTSLVVQWLRLTFQCGDKGLIPGQRTKVSHATECNQNFFYIQDINEKNEDKWKYISCSWTGRINIVKISIHKAIYRFNAIPTKIPMAFSQK